MTSNMKKTDVFEILMCSVFIVVMIKALSIAVIIWDVIPWVAVVLFILSTVSIILSAVIIGRTIGKLLWKEKEK